MPKSIYSTLLKVPKNINHNLTSPTAMLYEQLFGHPRIDRAYTTTSQGVTNPFLQLLCKTENVGPFYVTGLKLAVDSLKDIMFEILVTYPELISRLNSDGMCSVRYVNGTHTLSNHSWGAAIDLKVDRIKDEQRDDKILFGLALIIHIFNKHGWFSGAGYRPKKDKKTGKIRSNEDSMHFEVSKELILHWALLGYLGSEPQKVASGKNIQRRFEGNESGREKRDGQGEFTARVLAGQAKLRPAAQPKLIPELSTNVFRGALPRRVGEAYSRWLGRTVASLAKNPSSWFR